MKRTFIKGFLFVLILGFTLVAVSLSLVPKAVLVDKLLSRAGVGLFPSKVKEGMLSLKFEGLKVFYRDMEVAFFEKLYITALPTALELRGTCARGTVKATASLFGSFEFVFKDANCTSFVGSLEGKLYVKDDVKGRLKLSGIELQGNRVDSVELEFRGKEFSGRIDYLGMTLKGGGKLKLNKKDIARTLIDARFKGSIGELIVSGYLSNLSLRTAPP